MIKINQAINILGTIYVIKFVKQKKIQTDSDGYCDWTKKRIVVGVYEKSKDSVGNLDKYQLKVIRHEVIHAFLFESGLNGNWEHQQGHDETYVDWIAFQLPKINKALTEAGFEEAILDKEGSNEV